MQRWWSLGRSWETLPCDGGSHQMLAGCLFWLPSGSGEDGYKHISPKRKRRGLSSLQFSPLHHGLLVKELTPRKENKVNRLWESQGSLKLSQPIPLLPKGDLDSHLENYGACSHFLQPWQTAARRSSSFRTWGRIPEYISKLFFMTQVKKLRPKAFKWCHWVNSLKELS